MKRKSGYRPRCFQASSASMGELKSNAANVFLGGSALPTTIFPLSAIHSFAHGAYMNENATASVSLVLGGVRSGKSRHAQQLAERARDVVFVATGSAADEEMSLRIERHRAERPAHWRTVEEPLKLPPIIRDIAPSADLILVDCLTFFAATLLERCGNNAAELEGHIEDLCRVLTTPPCSIVLVSNEVGSGVVPPYPLGRRYRDLLGEINQRVASVADHVVLMVAGLPLSLKSSIRTAGIGQ